MMSGVPVEEFRTLNKISQTELATMLHVSQATVSRWSNRDVRIVVDKRGRLKAFEIRQVGGSKAGGR